MERLRCWKINGSQFNIIQYKFLPILILIFSVCGINGDVTLSVDPAMSRGRPSFITCTTTNQITAGVEFSKDNAASQGTCYLPGGPCESTIPGYSVTQDVSTRTTTLRIDSVSCTRETGSWYCQHGGDPRSPTVYIGCNTTKYSPSIDKSQFPSTYTVIAGRQLNINCASYTTPGRPSDTSYTWTHPDGSTTSGSTLNINSIDSNQSGQFTCTASNIFSSTQQGQDSATVQVQVQFPPTVLGKDSSYPVVESSPLNINCSSYTTPGNPSTTSYRWTGPDSYTSTGPVLSISSISRTQTGQYTCTASNTLTPTGGPPQTGTAIGLFSVDVQYLQRPLLIFESNEVLENETAKMSCVVESNPTAELTVRNIDNNTDVVRRKTNSLHYTILRAQCLHNGTFICSADNDITGRLYSNKRELNILCAPRRDYRFSYKQDVTGEVNEVASFVANIIANPTPVYSWYQYNNQQLIPIPNTTVHTVTSTGQNSILQITPRNLRDYGSYAVKVVNNQGSLQIVFKLIQMTNVAVSIVPPATDRFGVGIGVGFAISLPIIFGLVIGLLVVLRKQRQNQKSKHDASDHRNEISLDQQITSPQNTYADLSREQPPPNEYEQLQTLEQVKGSRNVYQNTPEPKV